MIANMFQYIDEPMSNILIGRRRLSPARHESLRRPCRLGSRERCFFMVFVHYYTGIKTYAHTYVSLCDVKGSLLGHATLRVPTPIYAVEAKSTRGG